MKDDETTIDAAVAAYKELADTFEREAAAYDTADGAGEIGFEAFCRMAALGEELAASAAALQGRINEALKTVRGL
jgi:hypothetical protein